MIDNISKALNTTFEPEVAQATSEIEKINEELKVIETKKSNIKSKFVMEDKEYIEFELKSLIASTQNVKARLEDELLKAGTKASMYEAYTLVCNIIQNSLRELRQLNRDVVDVVIAERRMVVRETETGVNKITGPVTVNNSFNLNSNDIDAMIRHAKENSQLNAIEVDFAADHENIKA